MKRLSFFASMVGCAVAQAVAAQSIGNGYRPPPPPSPVGALIADGKSARLTFPGIGIVAIVPLVQRTTATPRCVVRIVPEHGPAQVVTTIGTDDTEALSCGGVRAFGRLPAPAGRYRVGLIYRAFSPNTTVSAPVILTRTLRDPRWRNDDDLANRLTLPDGLDTIPQIRAYLARRKE